MKKTGKFTPLLALCALLAAVVLLIPFAVFTDTASAATYDYEFELAEYDVIYDVKSNGTIEVTEDIKVNYLGYRSTGFMRDIPTNAGAEVKNVAVEGLELLHGGTNVPYEVRIDFSNFITVDIGDATNKYRQSEKYRLTYLYCVSNDILKSGLFPVNPIGTGWECEIKKASVTIILPDGFLSAEGFIGPLHSTEKFDFIQNGNVITASLPEGRTLKKYEGITFNLYFEEGTISPYFDITPYWFVTAGVALVILTVLVKVLFFSKNNLTPVVNFEAPESMDPLLMGKLIDNKVNAEDVTALIFYWADKGYLKINLENRDDPTIIKIKNLPATASAHEQIVFAGLFKGGEMVRPSQLKYSFYHTFERATASVNAQSKGLFQSSSIGVSILFALFGSILVGIAPLLSGMFGVHSTLVWFYSIVAVIPALVLYGLTETLMYNRFKYRGKKQAIYYGLIVLAIIVMTLFYTVLVPSSLMPVLPKILMGCIGFANVALAVIIISRSPDYNKKLGDIVGFRKFIILAEKNRLETLLEDDPQFYYHILPYAQVLDVSDIWEDKFKDLTVAPPKWVTATDIISFSIISHNIRHSMARIASDMIARPASSGLNGGGGGHSFGGGSGGGFGGGGGRGR